MSDQHDHAADPAAEPAGPPRVEPGAVYELVGGIPFFEALVDRFYQGVMADPVLAPNYPEDDLEGAKVRLTYFLVQYWGGPTTYSDHRGHPRLRMRHFPFAIGMAERDAWLTHMAAAVDASDAPEAVRSLFHQYFSQASLAMINQP